MRLTLTTALALAVLSSLIPGSNRGLAEDAGRNAPPKPAPAGGPPAKADEAAKR